MVTELETRLKGNILAPLTFEEGEIDKFTRDHRCICGCHLLAKHVPDRKYIAFCPDCNVDIMEHNHVTEYKADVAKQSVTDGKHELRKPTTPRDEETILAELGF